MKLRKLALCVNTWSSEETVHAWVWLKTHLLQAKDPARVADELYVIHVANTKSRDKPGPRWDAGGPVVPDVRTAISGYTARVIELEGAPGAAIVDFVNKEDIEVLVIGSRGRGNIRRKVLGSVTEYVLRRVKCACLVARPKVGVGDSYRMTVKAAAQPLPPSLSFNVNSQPSSPTESVSVAPKATTRQLSLSAVRLGVSPPQILTRQLRKPDPTAVGDASIRRIAVFFDTVENGRAVLSWLQQTVLIPADTVFVLQWKSWPLASQLRAQQLTAPSPEVNALIEEVLPGHSKVLVHQLQSDKSNITNYVQKEAIDLMVIGRTKRRTGRGALTGKRISTYLYLASPCPCVLVPLGPFGADDDTDSDVDSADEGQQVFSSDDDYGPAVSSPNRARSASPGQLDRVMPLSPVSGVPTLVQTVQEQLRRVQSDNHRYAGAKELLVQLDDRGQVLRLTPVSKLSPALSATLSQELGQGHPSPTTPGTPVHSPPAPMSRASSAKPDPAAPSVYSTATTVQDKPRSGTATPDHATTLPAAPHSPAPPAAAAVSHHANFLDLLRRRSQTPEPHKPAKPAPQRSLTPPPQKTSTPESLPALPAQPHSHSHSHSAFATATLPTDPEATAAHTATPTATPTAAAATTIAAQPKPEAHRGKDEPEPDTKSSPSAESAASAAKPEVSADQGAEPEQKQREGESAAASTATGDAKEVDALPSPVGQLLQQKDDEIALLKKQLQAVRERDEEIAALKKQLQVAREREAEIVELKRQLAASKEQEEEVERLRKEVEAARRKREEAVLEDQIRAATPGLESLTMPE